MGEAEKLNEAEGEEVEKDEEEGEKEEEEEGAVCIDELHGSSLPSTTDTGIS